MRANREQPRKAYDKRRSSYRALTFYVLQLGVEYDTSWSGHKAEFRSKGVFATV